MSANSSISTVSPVRAQPRARRRARLPRGRSDDALVARVRGGDERAFELVFDRYHRGLLAFCRHMLGSTEEAEDAVQHTFMAAYRGLRGSDARIRLKAWLYTIARNRCLSMLRARREQVAFDEAKLPTDGLGPELERRSELRGLLADLEQLPDEQRAALVLFELGDHSHDEIAEVLGVRREKVKALVFQARESLASWRRAREAPCPEIREQLATLRGSALKRATLRRHVARCEGCAGFEAEVRRQRAAMAVLLPVVPSIGLKATVLSAVGIGGGSGAAGAAGAAGGSLAGLSGAAKGVAAKTLACAAVAGSAGSAGYVAVREVQLHGGSGPPIAGAATSPHHHRASAKRAAAPAAPAPKTIVASVAATTPAVAKAPKPGAGAKRRGWRGHGRGQNGERHGFGRGGRDGSGRGAAQRKDGVRGRSGGAGDGRGRRSEGGGSQRGRFGQRRGRLGAQGRDGGPAVQSIRFGKRGDGQGGAGAQSGGGGQGRGAAGGDERGRSGRD